MNPSTTPNSSSMRESFVQTTAQLLEHDKRVALVLADISVGLFRETGAMSRHPERIINVGIREQLMVGVAGGLALEGLRPIAHTYAPFLVERPFEQLKLDLSHQGTGAVLVSIGGSFDAAASGRTHQALGDVALVGTLPDWRIFVPGHPSEVETLLRRAVADEGNFYIRLSQLANSEPRVVVPGQLDVVRRGSAEAPTVIAVGPMLDPAQRALEGLDATLLYCTSPHPLDKETLRIASTGTNVFLIEPYLEGTSTHEVVAALDDKPRRVVGLGVPNKEHRHYGTAEEHQEAHGLDAASLRRRLSAYVRSANVRN